jgi:hypothetical protein
MVRKGGLEPPHIAAPEPKSGVSTNSTTSALKQRDSHSLERKLAISTK